MRHARRALRALGLIAALTVAAPPATTAHAADPIITTGIEIVDDTDALVTDTASDLLRGCTPTVVNGGWSLIWKDPIPYVPAGSTTTWYQEEGGGKAVLSCTVPVKITARVIDDSLPPFLPYASPPSPRYLTSTTPWDTAINRVPYYGPDAPLIRPYGHITIHVEIYRKVSTGRYYPVRFGCMEWQLIFEPLNNVHEFVPSTDRDTCTWDAGFLIADTMDSVSQQ